MKQTKRIPRRTREYLEKVYGVDCTNMRLVSETSSCVTIMDSENKCYKYEKE